MKYLFRQLSTSAVEIIEIGKDGLCTCSCADPCPLNKSGSMYRCSEEALKMHGFELLKKKQKK